MRIRSYQDTDEAQVVSLWQIAFPNAPTHNNPLQDIHRKLRVQRELFFVAIEEDSIIGTALAGYDGHRGWIYYVAVHPQHRRKRVGTALMKHAETELTAIGCPKLNLQVRADNRSVIAFYESLGPNAARRAFAFDGRDHSQHDNYGAYELARCVVEGIRASGLPLARLLVADPGPFDPSKPDPIDQFKVPDSPLRKDSRPRGNGG